MEVGTLRYTILLTIGRDLYGKKNDDDIQINTSVPFSRTQTQFLLILVDLPKNSQKKAVRKS